MLHHDNLLRTGIIAMTVAGISCGVTSCTMLDSPHSNNAATQQTSVKADVPEDLRGCNEVDIDSKQRGVLGTNGAVNETSARKTVVYAYVSAGSHIGLTGESSCLWITGDIGPNVAISVVGHGSGIVIQGSIDPSVRIDAGAGMITWIPGLVSPSRLTGAPHLRISDNDGGRLIINGMQTIEP